jgi:hypothetical protein
LRALPAGDLHHQAQWRRLQRAHQVTGAVLGAIVDHDDFQILVGLLQHRFDGLADVLGGVVGRDDD